MVWAKAVQMSPLVGTEILSTCTEQIKKKNNFILKKERYFLNIKVKKQH